MSSLRGSGPPSRVIGPGVRPRPFPPGMDPGVRSRHRIQDANPVCAFSPVLGVRPSAVDPVPGPGSQVPGTRDLEPGTRRLSSKKPAHYARCRKGPGGGQSPNLHPISAFRNLANPVCAFSGGRARSSVLGVRSSASDRLRCRVPGPRCRIAGTRYLVPGTWYLSSKTRTWG
jgi:hypothetical protein